MRLGWFVFLLMPSVNSFQFTRRAVVEGASFTLASTLGNDTPLNEEPASSPHQARFTTLGKMSNEIYFYGSVSQQSCLELRNQLHEMDLRMKMYSIEYGVPSPPIKLHIQSEGGSLYHSLYIIDLIQNIQTPVHTYVDGFAASAATLFSVVGEKRYMTKNSLMLIHQLSGSEAGKYEELKDQMENLGSLMKIIKKTYLSNSNLNEGTLDLLLTKDIWLDSDTCLKYGLIDEIL